MPDDGLYFKPKHAAGTVTKIVKTTAVTVGPFCLSRMSRLNFAPFV